MLLFQIPVEIMNLEVGDEIYNDDYYIMIESEVYFEPYQHVLKALQDPNFPEQLAMKKYIVDVDVSMFAECLPLWAFQFNNIVLK